MSDTGTTLEPLGRDARDWHGYYAGVGSRAMGYVVDAVLVVVGFYCTVGFASLLVAMITLERPRLYNFSDGAVLLAILLFAWGYLSFTVWVFSRTPGMALFGLRVVSKKGERPGFLRALVRAPAYLVSYIGFGLGFAWILVSPRKRAWHDYIANTCVVYDWDARPGARYREARARARERGYRPL